MPTEPYKSPSGELSERKFLDQYMEEGQLDSIEGDWVGKEKKRYDFTLKLLEQKTTTRGYFVYRMTDRHGNIFIAFDGRSQWNFENSRTGEIDQLGAGECFTCKATVNRPVSYTHLTLPTICSV